MNQLLPWTARALAFTTLALCLLAEWLTSRSAGVAGSLMREVQAVFRDPQTQWMIMACLVVYFVTFLLLDRPGTSSSALPKPALLLLVTFALLAYMRDYSNAVGSMNALALIGGIVLGQAFAFWVARERPEPKRLPPALFVATALILLLAAAALWHPNLDYTSFAYLGQRRWTGPWTNPNIYGLLMGAGLVLAAGMLRAHARQTNRSWKTRLCLGICACAIPLLCLGLARSYSRGAWVATLAGLCLLIPFVLICVHSWFLGPRVSPRRALPTSAAAVPLGILFLSLVILVMLNFRGSDHVLLRRVASIANPNDFSWRNRVASWEGALQMMADKPLLGHGWNGETVYEAFYKPAALESGMAIQMNDYLTLGVATGIPGLLSFAAIIGCAFASASGLLRRGGEESPSTPVAIAFTAAALVLAAGFWFDGGLLKLATASVFWVLILHGIHHEKRETHETESSSEWNTTQKCQDGQTQSQASGETQPRVASSFADTWRENSCRGSTKRYCEFWGIFFLAGAEPLTSLEGNIKTIMLLAAIFVITGTATACRSYAWGPPDTETESGGRKWVHHECKSCYSCLDAEGNLSDCGTDCFGEFEVPSDTDYILDPLGTFWYPAPTGPGGGPNPWAYCVEPATFSCDT